MSQFNFIMEIPIMEKQYVYFKTTPGSFELLRYVVIYPFPLIDPWEMQLWYQISTKLMSRIDILRISCKIALSNSTGYHWRWVNID